jgi:hypothetical protein
MKGIPLKELRETDIPIDLFKGLVNLTSLYFFVLCFFHGSYGYRCRDLSENRIRNIPKELFQGLFNLTSLFVSFAL